MEPTLRARDVVLVQRIGRAPRLGEVISVAGSAHRVIAVDLWGGYWHCGDNSQTPSGRRSPELTTDLVVDVLRDGRWLGAPPRLLSWSILQPERILRQSARLGFRALRRQHLASVLLHGLHTTVVDSLIPWVERLGLMGVSAQPPKGLATRLTAVVKTFERPQAVARLIASLRAIAPGLPVVVVDDSEHPVDIPGVTQLRLPYDSGIGVGRNAGVRAVKTPYLLMLDDDLVMSAATDLGRAVRFLDQHRQADLVGGRWLTLPRCRWEGDLVAEGSATCVGAIDELPVVTKTANFFVARTSVVRTVGWDEALKRVEHADFFIRARGRLTAVYDAGLACYHCPTPFLRRYQAKRSDTRFDLALLAWKQQHGSGGAQSMLVPSRRRRKQRARRKPRRLKV